MSRLHLCWHITLYHRHHFFMLLGSLFFYACKHPTCKVISNYTNQLGSPVVLHSSQKITSQEGKAFDYSMNKLRHYTSSLFHRLAQWPRNRYLVNSIRVTLIWWSMLLQTGLQAHLWSTFHLRHGWGRNSTQRNNLIVRETESRG